MDKGDGHPGARAGQEGIAAPRPFLVVHLDINKTCIISDPAW
jgi:hypothetical protein